MTNMYQAGLNGLEQALADLLKVEQEVQELEREMARLPGLEAPHERSGGGAGTAAS